jgi:ketosteroid isomerase-like protein
MRRLTPRDSRASASIETWTHSSPHGFHYRDTFDEWRIEVEQLIEGRRERVIAFVHDGGRIKGSTREILQPVFHVYEFRAGKVVSLQIFLDRAEALEAVGLSEEQDAHADS